MERSYNSNDEVIEAMKVLLANFDMIEQITITREDKENA